MNWVTTLLPKQLIVGENPSRAGDALWIVKSLHVTHIVSLLSQRPDGTEAKHYYEEHYAKEQGKNPIFKAPKVIRIPLPAHKSALSTRNEKEQLLWYTSAARQVADLLKGGDENVVVYIHNRDGRNEEAIVGMIAWAMVDCKTAPMGRLNQWCTDTHNQLLLDSEGLRALTIKGMVQSKTLQTQGLQRFLKKRK